jgi:hypothetical protein
VDNCDIVSRQDTILINANTSQGYFNNCRVIGNFDYIWGVGVGYFNNCVFHTVTNTTSSSYNLTAARTFTSGTLSVVTPWVNPNGVTYSAYGFAFVGCTFEADSGVTGITLAGSNGTAGGLDTWVGCTFDTNAYVSPSVTLSNTYVFWQNSNRDITGSVPITYTNVQVIGFTNSDPRLLASTNPVVWFSGWLPQLAAYIITQPVSLSVPGGQPASFIVVASGIEAPSYQWLKNGTNLNGQTAATLSIATAYAGDAGIYSVIVSNTVGLVISSNATLTVGNTAPTLNPISDQTINAGAVLNITSVATDPDVPPQTLTFSLLSFPAGATIDPNSGLFTWRPLVSQANTTNLVTIQVTDNGSPNLNASQSFNVIVNPLMYPTLSSITVQSNQVSFTVSNGTVGPDYIVLTSTNLLNWQPIFTNSSPAQPFTFTDTNTAAFPVLFYRIQLAP